jgi:prepilin-type N-terminal cleavage/methylation domain-containing protein
VSDDGYTLTETLAAMAVIGLTMGGVSLGMQVLGAQQSGVGAVAKRTQDARAAETWLEQALADGAPFGAHQPARLSGDASGLVFDCDASAPCEARLTPDGDAVTLRLSGGRAAERVVRLAGPRPARFAYRGLSEALTSWPPAGGVREPLRSVALLEGQQVLLEARVHAEQPVDCAFDPVLKDCR